MVSSTRDDEIERYRAEIWYSIDLFGERAAVQLGRLVELVLKNVGSTARNALKSIEGFLFKNLGEGLKINGIYSRDGYLLARVARNGGEELTVGLGEYRELRRIYI